MRTIRRITALLALISGSAALAADDMKAFPAAEEGMTRHVIRLPKQDDETAFKVELIIGGYLSADAFSIANSTVVLRASVSGLPANADPVAALISSVQRSKRK